VKAFLLKFIFYTAIIIIIHFLLFLYLAGVGMADDIGTEERQRLASIPLFLINKIFGFPLSLIFQYDPINAKNLFPGPVSIFLLNCLIQFSILSFMWRRFRKIISPPQR